MLTTAALYFFLVQVGGPVAPHREILPVDCAWCVEDSVSQEETRRRAARYEEQEFLRRFNGLAAALRDFSQTYNSRGVMDVKKIKAIRKALRELEKSEWFSQKYERRESR